jgi:hypothetical protein
LKIAGVIAAIAAALGIFPVWWQVAGHWMNRQEIEASNEKQDQALKAHAQHDAQIQGWNQFGFADTRRQFLEDHKFECDSKRMLSPKLAPIDAAMCQRYEAQLLQKAAEAADLKSKALEAGKEKAQ